jgi:hypothetical protein
VTVTVTNPVGKATTLNGTTGSSGAVSVTYGMRKNQSPVGTYTVSSRATIGNMTGSATTSFVLN